MTTKPLTPAELPPGLSDSTTTRKQLGIGQRCILLQTNYGNILWDLIAFLNQDTIDFINEKGGLKAIVISHPHFYTTHLEWAAQFNCPVYVAEDDKEWLNRNDSKGVRQVYKGTKEVVPGVTVVQCGGHFDGSSVLHWDNKLFIADTMMSVPVSSFAPIPAKFKILPYWGSKVKMARVLTGYSLASTMPIRKIRIRRPRLSVLCGPTLT